MKPDVVFRIEQIVGLVQLGLSTVSAIQAALARRTVTVVTAQGELVTAAQVAAAVDAAQAAALAAGDQAAQRLEDRHPPGSDDVD